MGCGASSDKGRVGYNDIVELFEVPLSFDGIERGASWLSKCFFFFHKMSVNYVFFYKLSGCSGKFRL